MAQNSKSFWFCAGKTLQILSDNFRTYYYSQATLEEKSDIKTKIAHINMMISLDSYEERTFLQDLVFIEEIFDQIKNRAL